MTTLYLVRHGETVDNARQILQGQMPGTLNVTGIRQAESVRDKMCATAIDAFISSDLARSYAMCKIIAAPHHKEVETSKLLREREWGDFTGAFIPDLTGKEWPANVETLDAMRVRARRFLNKLRVDYPGQTVLAVGHGIINKAIQSVFYDKPMNEVPKMENAEVRVLKL